MPLRHQVTKINLRISIVVIDKKSGQDARLLSTLFYNDYRSKIIFFVVTKPSPELDELSTARN
jgi:hypothetical protein